MNSVGKFCASFAIAVWWIHACGAESLHGTWTLRIEDPQHREHSVATIRFTEDAATACISGNWKRVTVISIVKNEGNVFPLNEQLSYSLDGTEVTIGRN